MSHAPGHRADMAHPSRRFRARTSCTSEARDSQRLDLYPHVSIVLGDDGDLTSCPRFHPKERPLLCAHHNHSSRPPTRRQRPPRVVHMPFSATSHHHHDSTWSLTSHLPGRADARDRARVSRRGLRRRRLAQIQRAQGPRSRHASGLMWPRGHAETVRVAQDPYRQQARASRANARSPDVEPSRCLEPVRHTRQGSICRLIVRARYRDWSHIAPSMAPLSSRGRVGLHAGRTCRLLRGGPVLQGAEPVRHERSAVRPLVAEKRDGTSSGGGPTSCHRSARHAERSVGDGPAEAERAQARRARRVASPRCNSGRRFDGHAERRRSR